LRAHTKKPTQKTPPSGNNKNSQFKTRIKLKRKKRDFEFYTGVGVDDGGATAEGACSGCGLIWKKAITINNTPIHIRRRPMMTIVRHAPIISSRPAVENKPTLDLVARVFSDRLTKKAQTMMKIHRITNAASIPANTETTVLEVRFDVLGVMPESDEADDHWPFQDG
jgi:hypothetical protein